MLVLFETAAGYAIFKLLDEKKLKQTQNLYEDFETPEGASKVLALKCFQKFQDTTDALAMATASVEGKMCKGLKKLLKKLFVKEAHETLAVADAKLGNVIKEKLNISCVSDSAVHELMRCIRSQADSLIGGISQRELAAMSLGLAHSLSRYKLKFSPDKVDTMIVQAISLLDDLDKELNNYIMRCREWYGWHFPELGKILSDNVTYIQVVKALGMRENASACDLSELLSKDIEDQIKETAEISMGTEISEEDITNIIFLCDQVLEMSQYRNQLYEYLQNRMFAIAPNLTVLVGDMVGARLISHAGSLLNLAKHPASTVQILGAEKALFRALKTQHDTPKYGLIYHAQLISQTNSKLKGKMSRMLAAKTSLACRVDALGEETSQDLGIDHRAKLEIRLKQLEEGQLRRISGTGRSQARWEKYENRSEVKTYTAIDSTVPSTSKKRLAGDIEGGDSPSTQKPAFKKIKVESEEAQKTPKKPKRKRKKRTTTELTESPVVAAEQNKDDAPPQKKKKKKKNAKN